MHTQTISAPAAQILNIPRAMVPPSPDQFSVIAS